MPVDKARGWVVALAAICLVSALTACESEPRRVQRLPIPDGLGVPSSKQLGEVLRAARQLGELRGRLLANCMADHGFPEPLEALTMATETPAQYVSGPMNVVPIDLGPSTQFEARTYGFAGATFPIDAGGGPGIVVSRNPDFDRQAEECQLAVNQHLPSLTRLQTDTADLSNRVRTAFVERVFRHLRSPLIARLECVRQAGYPQLDARRALDLEAGEVLTALGVEPGRELHVHESPTEADVDPGAVGVFPADPVRSYQPSSEERSFALAYVRCGQIQHFGDTVRAVESSARKYVERRYRSPGRRTYRALKSLDRDIRSSPFSEGTH